MKLMGTSQVFRSVLLASGVLLIAACASHPVSSPASATVPGPLLEKKFEIAAAQYQKFQHEGQTMYCRKEKVVTSAVPVAQCLTEPQLRLQVENSERWRNPVQRGGPQVVSAGIGG
jgi:hypothetical protein